MLQIRNLSLLQDLVETMIKILLSILKINSVCASLPLQKDGSHSSWALIDFSAVVKATPTETSFLARGIQLFLDVI